MGVIAFFAPFLLLLPPHLVSSFYGLTKASEKRDLYPPQYSPKEEGLTKLFLATMNRRIFIQKVLFPLFPFWGGGGLSHKNSLPISLMGKPFLSLFLSPSVSAL